MPHEHLWGKVTRTDPISLLTHHGALPWYDDYLAWPVMLLEEVYWLAEIAAEETTHVIECAVAWGIVPLGRN